jgi:hypothetical protein
MSGEGQGVKGPAHKAAHRGLASEASRDADPKQPLLWLVDGDLHKDGRATKAAEEWKTPAALLAEFRALNVSRREFLGHSCLRDGGVLGCWNWRFAFQATFTSQRLEEKVKA